jgi:hypothetical protein
MKENINDKTSPNQMRVFMKRMRDGYVVESSKTAEHKTTLSMRDMLKITRKLNEEIENKPQNKKTDFDQNIEEEKFRNFFNDLTVSIKFIELEVFDDFVFWGGTVDGIIQFVYKVTPDESTSGVEFNYLEDFSPDNPENEEVVGRIESYFDTFYKYWRDNIMSTDSKT